MNNALEFLHTRFEGDHNALAEWVSLSRSVQQPDQALLDYAATIRLRACYCAYPDTIINQATHDGFATGVRNKSIRQAICCAYRVATKANQVITFESAIDAANLEQ